MMPVHVIGLGMSPGDLTPRALRIIQEAQVLVGGRRLLHYFPDHPGEKITLGQDPEGVLRQIPDLAASRRVVVLASGDPNFYGVGPLVVKVLGPENVVLHPNVTAVQAACARLCISWQDATVISLHGRSWEPLAAALQGRGTVIIYTDPAHTPGAIAGFLRERGRGQARFWVLEDLGQETERVRRLAPEEAEREAFSPLNMVVLELDAAGGETPTPTPLYLGLPEEALEHQAGLITKLEVRVVVLARLELHPGQVLWDVGAGCGSVGLEAGLLLTGGKIYAIEQDPQRAAQIQANREKFGVRHLEVICGQAPECLAGLPAPQRVFVGGGGSRLPIILQEVMRRLDAHGKVVVTAALLETLELARNLFNQAGWDVDVTQVQVSRSRSLGTGRYLQALNPVWLITARPPRGEA